MVLHFSQLILLFLRIVWIRDSTVISRVTTTFMIWDLLLLLLLCKNKSKSTLRCDKSYLCPLVFCVSTKEFLENVKLLG